MRTSKPPTVPTTGDFETHRVPTNEETPRFRRVTSTQMGDTGFDSPTTEIAVTSRDSLELWQTEQVAVESGGAESGAVGAENVVLSVSDDPRLLALIDAWLTLPEDARDAIARLAGQLSLEVTLSAGGEHGVFEESFWNSRRSSAFDADTN